MRADQRRLLIARRLAGERHAAGVTAAELAGLARCHVNDVRRYEAAEQAVPVAYVVAAAERLEVTTDYLLGRADVPRPWATIPQDAVSTTLLRDAILLTHPDRHPPQRGPLATRVTQELNALLGTRPR